jgi:hypothetical protein
MSRALLLVVVVLLAGCGGGNDGTNHEGLVGALRSEGVDPQTPQPEPPGILGVRWTVYQVPGGELHVFPFRTAAAAETAAARVAPDGYTVRSKSGINQAVDWAAPPHWYRDGREVAVYIGSSQDVIDALSEVAGEQFAGA